MTATAQPAGLQEQCHISLSQCEPVRGILPAVDVAQIRELMKSQCGVEEQCVLAYTLKIMHTLHIHKHRLIVMPE